MQEKQTEIVNSAELAAANELTDGIRRDLQSAQQSLMSACIRLAEVREKKLYKVLNCRNFEEYCEHEINLAYRQGRKYADIGVFFQKWQSTATFENVQLTEHFQQLGVEKLYLIARTEEKIREEVARTTDLESVTVKELKARITELEKQNKQLSEKIDDRFDRLEKKIQADKEKHSEESAVIPDERPTHPLKPSFILFCDYIHDIAKLSMTERGELLTAIMYYANNLPVPEVSGNVGLIFGIIKRQIDRDYEKWLKTKEERTAAGKNGGLKTQKNNRKNQAIAKAVNVSVTENVNANDIVSDYVYVNSDSEKEKNINSNQQNNKFKIPTAEEVRSYCNERGNGINPEYFFDYYSARGWKIGQAPMCDWQATVRAWEQNNHKKQAEKNESEDDFDVSKYEEFVNRF